jgi:hypothetical protein
MTVNVKTMNAKQQARQVFADGYLPTCPLCGKSHPVLPATPHDDAVIDCWGDNGRLLWEGDLAALLDANAKNGS